MRKAIEGGCAFVKDTVLMITEDEQSEEMQDLLNKANIKYVYLPFQSTFEFSESFLLLLKEYKIDYVFCNGRHILKGNILKYYKNKIVNFHGALLPRYKGRMQLDEMLNEKEFLLGTSAIFIDEGVDTGPVIMEAVIPAEAFYKRGYDIVLDTQMELMDQVYILLAENRIKIENGRVIIEGARYEKFGIFPEIW